MKTKIKFCLVCIFIFASAFFIRCNSTDSNTETETPSQIDTLKDMISRDFQDAKDGLAAQRDSLNTAIQDLRENIKSFSAEKKQQAQEQLEKLEAKKNEIEAKLKDKTPGQD